MRETYEPTLLARRAFALRKTTSNPHLRSKFDLTNLKARDIFLKAIVRPSKMRFLSPHRLRPIPLHMAVVYEYLYLLFTTLTLVFERPYGFSSGQRRLDIPRDRGREVCWASSSPASCPIRS